MLSAWPREADDLPEHGPCRKMLRQRQRRQVGNLGGRGDIQVGGGEVLGGDPVLCWECVRGSVQPPPDSSFPKARKSPRGKRPCLTRSSPTPARRPSSSTVLGEYIKGVGGGLPTSQVWEKRPPTSVLSRERLIFYGGVPADADAGCFAPLPVGSCRALPPPPSAPGLELPALPGPVGETPPSAFSRPSFEDRKRLGLATRRKGGNFKSKAR